MRTANAAGYCPNPAHARPEKVPAELVPALAAAFGVDKGAVGERRRRALRRRQIDGLRRRRQSQLRQGRYAPFVVWGDGVVSQPSGSGRYSDGRHRPRHDLRLVVQGPRRRPGKGDHESRSAGLCRPELERDSLTWPNRLSCPIRWRRPLAAPRTLRARIRRRILPYHDLRQWLDEAQKLGEVKDVEGLSWQRDIGMVAEMSAHTDNAPCFVFEDVPGTLPGSRAAGQFLRRQAQEHDARLFRPNCPRSN